MSAPATLPPELRAHVDLDALADWMQAAGLGSGPVTKADVMTGGTQNVMLRLNFAGRKLVFRRTPTHPREASNRSLRREARMLGALDGTDVPHPVLIASEPDANALGYVFLLMEVVDGVNPTEAPVSDDPDFNRRLGFSYVEALAKLTSVDVAAVGLSDFGKPQGFLERQVPQWQGVLEGYSRVPDWPGANGLPDVTGLADWLTKNRPADAAPGLLHGDCHIGNTMIQRDSPEIAALIDWEMSTVADPRLDLGWVMATWPVLDAEHADSIGVGFRADQSFAPLGELVAHYAERTSRPLDRADWFGAMACFKLAVLLEGTHVRACAGKAPKAVGDRLHGMAVRLLERGAYFAQGWYGLA